MLNTQQQTDLANWKQDQKLPESLKNVFIEDCLEELRNNKEARNRFNLICPNKITENKDIFNKDKVLDDTLYYCMFTIETVLFSEKGFNNNAIKLQFILALLSRTPDGQAVMSFLDVETREYKEAKFEADCLEQEYKRYKYEDKARAEYCWRQCIDITNKSQNMIKTLDHLLFNSFVEALRTGKSFDEALEIITKIYILNIYGKHI